MTSLQARLAAPVAALVTLVGFVLLGDGVAAPVRASEPTVLPSALEPAGTGGAPAVDRALAKLSGNRRLLVIAAHPDDEDTALLARVSQMGGEAAYLSLSRGDGGQNLVGPELGVGLGLLRTEELLAARRVDGARQYFSRALDFGYTRSLDETLQRWGRAELAEDFARVVWRFRPQVVVSIFGNDGSGGHGQHQAAGWTAHETFAKLGDGNAFPSLVKDGLVPWQPAALYRGAWFAPELATATLSLAAVDPWSGRSVAQLAAASRSQHRSQDMGRLLELGPRDTKLAWVAGAGGKEAKDPFDGIDTRLAGIVAGLPVDGVLAPRLAAVEARARAARERLRPASLGELVGDFAAIVRELREIAGVARGCAALGCAHAAAILDEKLAVAEEGMRAAAGVALEASADRETLVPGETAKVTVSLWNSGARSLEVRGVRLATADGWATPAVPQAARSVAAGELARWTVDVPVPADAPPTAPYFLRQPPQGDRYDWSSAPAAVRGEPAAAPALTATLELAIDGATLAAPREVVYRYSDQAKGEIRRPLRVVPPIEVDLLPDLALLPRPALVERAVEAHLRSNAATPLAGTLVDLATCGAPNAPQPFSLPPHGELVLPLVARPCGDGSAPLAVAAELGGRRYAQTLPLVDYPHIRPVAWPHPATARLSAFDLRLPKLSRVGYVVGAADRMPEYLLEVGVPVVRLTAAELATGDLSGYDAIVVGARAYESDPGLAAANAHLLDYVRAGGLAIVQYQQYPFVEGRFAPLPLEIARPHDRITDETSPVVVLDPASPLFHTPNELGPADWNGWVQERALYMAGSWDPGYKPLLELHDPGEPAARGGLLVAAVGKGTYVYTGLSFFRQLPAGVPGAYRLFVNLLGLRAGATAESARGAELDRRTGDLLRRATVVDTHIDLPYRLTEEKADVSRRTAGGHFDWPRARSGGLDAAFMSIYIPAEVPIDGAARKMADGLIDSVEALVTKNPEKWAVARSPEEVKAVAAAGKIALALGIENGSAIEQDLANLRHFAERGVRYVTLTHGADNAIGDSSYSPKETRKWHGLSPFGREVVEEMNRLGVMVDISHVSDETFDQVIGLSRAPLIASHSSCRFFTPGFERNLDDERIRQLAAKGGVIQINFGNFFLTAAANQHGDLAWSAVEAFKKEKGLADHDPEIDRFRERYLAEHPQPKVTLDDVVAHIDHVVALVGVDHVGIGSDFDGVSALPEGLEDVSRLPGLVRRLLEKGYSDADVEKILGGNLLRVWSEVERIGRELRRGS